MRQRAIATLGLCLLAATGPGCMTEIAAFQPEIGTTIVLPTTGADGRSHERVLSPIDHDGQLLVAANHWPRAGYHRALDDPDVRVTRDGQTTDYRAVPVSDRERERPNHTGMGTLPEAFASWRAFWVLDGGPA